MTTRASEDERALHWRLLEGDPVAPALLAEAYLELLSARLLRYHPGVDPHHCEQAAGDAILALIVRPAAYDPELSTLNGYLYMAARRDLQNLLQTDARRGKHLADLAAVEVSPAGRKYLQDLEADPVRILALREEVEQMWAEQDAQVPEAVRAGLTQVEAQALQLMQAQVRETDAYATVLGISHLPTDERRRAVKRVKDRLKKRVERAGGGHVHSA